MSAFPAAPTHTPVLNPAQQFTEEDYRRIFNPRGGVTNVFDFVLFLYKNRIPPNADRDELLKISRYPSYQGLKQYLTSLRADFDGLFRKWISSLSELQMRLVLLRKEGGRRKTLRHKRSKKQTRRVKIRNH